jgi:hypothetical protein
MPFQSGRTGVTSTFNYNDIATGKSFVNHYGARASGAYLLMANKGYSDMTHTISSNTGGGLSIGVDTPAEDLNFDLEFDRPRMVEGETMISIPIVLGVDGINGVNGKLHVLIRKVVGLSEIELVDEVSRLVEYTGESSANGWRYFRMVAVIVDIPKTKFKRGEILRLTVRVYATNGGSGSGGVGHDPKGRSFVLHVDALSSTTTTASDLQFPIPFIVDI